MNKGRNKVILTTIFVVAIVFLTLVTGCSLLDGKSRDILTIAPVDLYAGDQEKFKPFMGHSASIKLDYNGKKKNLAFVYQIWENGIPIPNSKGGLSDHFFRLDEDLTTKSLEQAQQEAEWFFGLSVILTEEENIFP